MIGNLSLAVVCVCVCTHVSAFAVVCLPARPFIKASSLGGLPAAAHALTDQRCLSASLSLELRRWLCVLPAVEGVQFRE